MVFQDNFKLGGLFMSEQRVHNFYSTSQKNKTLVFFLLSLKITFIS